MTTSFHYKVPWPVQGFRQGDHNSSSTGDTGAYRADRLLRDAADARRLALRTSVRDPFSRWWVREYLHHATLNVWVLADVSQSMRTASTCLALAQLIRSTSLSSHRIGDRFGIVCAAQHIVEPLSRRAGMDQGTTSHLAGQLAELHRPDLHPHFPDSATASGLHGISGMTRAAARVGHQRSLVFVASDFHADAAQWHQVFQALRRHYVVPVVLWNLPELFSSGQRGLVTITDSETGVSRLLWMRKGLRRKIQDRLESRYEQLSKLFSENHVRPVFFYDGFDANLLTERFHGGHHVRKPPTLST